MLRSKSRRGVPNGHRVAVQDQLPPARSGTSSLMDLQLGGKLALVTGSHRGTGEVIARTLAAEGAQVIVHGSGEQEARDMAASMPAAFAVWGDVAQVEGVQQVAAQCQAHGEVDILVNNYGTAAAGKWWDTDAEAWIDMYQKNVLSGVSLVQALVPAMKHKGWGRVIQLGTVGSKQPGKVMPHYYAAKGALATMGVSLAQALANTGITVNTVSPGIIRTAEVEAGYRVLAERKGWGEDWDSIEAKIVERDYPNPCGRLATRQEVADAVVFLCSPRAGYINGQNLLVDGGAVRQV